MFQKISPSQDWRHTDVADLVSAMTAERPETECRLRQKHSILLADCHFSTSPTIDMATGECATKRYMTCRQLCTTHALTKRSD